MLLENSNNFFSGTDVGKVRQANEDNCGHDFNSPNGKIFVVCDGMGGHVGGATASKIAVDSILMYLQQQKYDDIQIALSESLKFANMQILGAAEDNPELHGMGTTACVVVIQDDKLWVAHVGDSRIYMYLGKEKQLHRITKDHSFVQGLIDQGMILDSEAETHPKKNVILKALGITIDLKPEVCSQAIEPLNNDIFLICSDGLCGMINDVEIEKILNEKSEVAEKGKKLIVLANENGGKDNITVQLIKIDGSTYKNRQFVSKNPKERRFNNNNLDKESKSRNQISIKLIGIIIALLIILSASTIFILWKFTNVFTPKTEQIISQDSIKIIVDTIPKTMIINEFHKILPNKNDIIYTGEINADSLPDGKGSCIYVNDKTGRLFYEGTWKNGFKVEGKLIYKATQNIRSDSAYFIGTFVDSLDNDGKSVSKFYTGWYYKNPKDTTTKIYYLKGESGKK